VSDRLATEATVPASSSRPGIVVLASGSLRSLRLCLMRLRAAGGAPSVVIADADDEAAAARIAGVRVPVVPVPTGTTDGERLRRGLEALAADAAVLLAAPATGLEDGGTSLLEAAGEGLAQPVTDAGRRLWVQRRPGWDDVETARTLSRRAEGDRPDVPRVDAPVLAGTREALDACAEEAGGWAQATWSDLARAAGRCDAVLDDRTWLHVPAPAATAWRAATADLDEEERDVRDRALDVVRSLRWSLEVADLDRAHRREPTAADLLLGAGRLRRRVPSTRLAAKLARDAEARRTAPVPAPPDAPRWQQGRLDPPTSAPREVPQGRSPSVAFLLPGLGAYGGVLSVLQLATRLRLRGIRATVAVDAPADPWAEGEALLAPPLVLPTTADLLRQLPPHHLVVGTRWDTWPVALELAARWRTGALAFVQDDELAQLAEGSDERVTAAAALDAFGHLVVKSRWLAERVAGPGREVHRIPLGLDRDVFRPRPAPGRPTAAPQPVVSPARPGVAHRNFDGTLAAFRELARRGLDVEPTFFGRPFAPVEDLAYRHAGRLSQEGVAALLGSAAVLLDASTWQGFGRPGLEAMACGVPAVLTPHGGITEYAEDGVNCLTPDPTDPAAVADAVEAVLGDGALATRLMGAGLETAERFDAELEADAWAGLVTDLLRH
jgi:glycosyltransferase involved in cell wall biosynthesis